jgi:hypothetical protein
MVVVNHLIGRAFFQQMLGERMLDTRQLHLQQSALKLEQLGRELDS